MSARRKLLAVNFAFLAGGEIVSKVLTFFSFSYLARLVGPARYGGLEFTLAVMVFFVLPVDLGLGAYGAREIAKDRQSAAKLLREITDLRLLLALCSLAGLAIFILVSHKPQEVKLLLAMYGVGLLLYPVLLQWFFQGHELMHWVSIASMIRQGVFAGLVFLFCRPWTSLIYIGVAECCSLAAVGLFSFVVTRFLLGFRLPLPALHFSHAQHLRSSSPIGFTELAWAFIWYFTTVLLGFTAADRSVGWFGASHRALMAMHTFVWLYLFNLLPSISRCSSRPDEELRALLRRSLRFAAWTSIPAAFFLTLLAEEILTVVYGAAFSAGAPAFSILVWMLPVSMLAGHYGYTLIGYGFQERLLRCTAISAAVAVALAFAIVPRFGGRGTACCLLAANLVNFFLQYKSVQSRITEVPFTGVLLRPCVSTAVAGGFFYVASAGGLNHWLAAFVGACAYCCALLWFEGRQLLGIFRGLAGRPETDVEGAMAG